MDGAFEKVIEFNEFDGSWAGQVVDHMIKYFVQYAIAADNEANQQKEILKADESDGQSHSGHIRLEKT
jgi:hypothetical protein